MSDLVLGHAALEKFDHDALCAALDALGVSPSEEDGRFLMWQLRYCIALNAVYYLRTYLPDMKQRTAVLDDVAAAWVECLASGGHAEGFQGFFDQYCIRVERNVDKSLHTSPRFAAEFRREWTSHAVAVSRRARRRRTRKDA